MENFLTVVQLSGKHQECPLCGGTDRWRFSDHDRNGSYYCNQCGPGSGFDLLMGMFGWSFEKAAKEVDDLLEEIDEDDKPFNQKIDDAKRRHNLNIMWRDGVALPHRAVTPYWDARGLRQLSQDAPELFTDIRYHPGMYLTDSKELHPGLIALVRDKEGRPVSLHRTYFDPKERKLMPPIGSMNGGGIKIGTINESDGELVVGEGLETTLSGCDMYSAAGYATVSAGLMEQFEVPKDCERLTILADNDRSFTGQKAAFTLARRYDNDMPVRVVMPSEPGYDFNDVHRGGYADIWEWKNANWD